VPNFQAFRRERMMGLEPTTFCMAIGPRKCPVDRFMPAKGHVSTLIADLAIPIDSARLPRILRINSEPETDTEVRSGVVPGEERAGRGRPSRLPMVRSVSRVAEDPEAAVAVAGEDQRLA
jgi:hypothetical protein